MAELKPCPNCGYAPRIGYACGEYFVMGTEECPFCIDAVEVVRCKDCKHLSDDGYCQQNLYGIAPHKIPKDEDFCSYGEKKMVNLEDVVDIEAQTKANNEAMRKVIGFMTGEET